jgi:hypothetical protein
VRDTTFRGGSEKEIKKESIFLVGQGISQPQSRYLHTEQHKHRINAHRHSGGRAKTVYDLGRVATVIDHVHSAFSPERPGLKPWSACCIRPRRVMNYLFFFLGDGVTERRTWHGVTSSVIWRFTGISCHRGNFSSFKISRPVSATSCTAWDSFKIVATTGWPEVLRGFFIGLLTVTGSDRLEGLNFHHRENNESAYIFRDILNSNLPVLEIF